MGRRQVVAACVGAFVFGAAAVYFLDRLDLDLSLRVPQAISTHTYGAAVPPGPGAVTAPGGALPSLNNTAFVTMVSNDENAMLALTLMQSLRDADTKVPNLLVMLMRGGTGSADCLDAEWKARNSRQGVSCAGPDTIAAEIVSEKYLRRFEALGVQTIVSDPLKETEFTRGIPGGRQSFWGMAFNKLLVFSLVQYRKLVWLDADDFFLRNVDHLLHMPMLTGSMVTACCRDVAPAYPGGGIWVVEPSLHLFRQLLDLIAHPRPGTVDESWMLGDMQVVRHFFGTAPSDGNLEPLFPAINDGLHGYVGGLRFFPAFSSWDNATFDGWVNSRLDSRKPRQEGFLEQYASPARIHWRALDMRYDQCVGSFACSPDRDAPEVAFSVHFSCLQNVDKPSKYGSEHDFMHALSTIADPHSRYWFLRWYESFKRAMGGVGLPAPLWEGAPLSLAHPRGAA